MAAVFATGTIDYRMVATIISRTENVLDWNVKRAVDAAIARHCVKWMRLSGPKLADRVDLWLAKHDPDAVRVPPNVKDNRFVDIGEISPGMAGIYGHLESPDAALLDSTLDALAATVCDNDPRTKEQRRADALGALSRRDSALGCRCGSADCAAVTDRNALNQVVIHVLAEQATLDETSDQPGYLPGFGVLPAESVRELAACATITPLRMPTGSEPGYRPSKALAAFIWWRDLTCRFPGCDAPAQVCDTDHTTPYPLRADPSVQHQALLPHTSSAQDVLRRLRLDRTAIPRRHHHLDGADRHTYNTPSHGGTLFPALAHPTGDLGDMRRARRIPAPRRDDAHPQTDPRPRPLRPHHQRTPPTQRTRQPTRTQAVGMARNQLRTATLLSRRSMVSAAASTPARCGSTPRTARRMCAPGSAPHTNARMMP